MSQPSGAEWLNLPVRIRGGVVRFGDHELPGIIAENGVTVHPGGNDDLNILTVTFIVGQVVVDDPFADDEADKP